MEQGVCASSARETVAVEAARLGFVLAGAAAVEPLDCGPFMENWLSDGRAGEMSWLARRTAERLDPRPYVDLARTVLAPAYPDAPPTPPPPPPRSRAGLPPPPAAPAGAACPRPPPVPSGAATRGPPAAASPT